MHVDSHTPILANLANFVESSARESRRTGKPHLHVVELVAEGLTNPQIAERMFIARGTVKVHLGHIFTKLTVSTRSELAAEVARRAALVSPKNLGTDP